MTRTVQVDGKPWRDGDVGVDQDGNLWRLTFVPSTWGPVHDRWSWEEFGEEVDRDFDSPAVKRPLTKIWPQSSDAGIDVTPDPGLSEPVEKPARRRSS